MIYPVDSAIQRLDSPGNWTQPRSFRSAGQLSLPTELVVPLGFVKDWSALLTEIFCFRYGPQSIVSDN